MKRAEAEEWFSALNLSLVSVANPTDAKAMAAYMKDHFAFFGVKSGPRREVLKNHVAQHGLPRPFDPNTLALLWQAPQREMQYCALDLLRKQARKVQRDDIHLIESLITTKSWWDTVDGLASWVCGPYFEKFPEQMAPITGQWAQSDNLWLRRSAIIFQLGYGPKTNGALLFHYIRLNLGSKEFFINKAIGWALRQYARTHAGAVTDFVATTPLAPLSRREALRNV